MEHNCKFSIIVPVYNVEDYIDRCVTSLLNQSYDAIEIILVDDGSLDNCAKICDQYSKIDTRVRVLHKENGGLSDARNAGLRVASGEYIIFVDGDDYIETDTCEKISEWLIEPVDIIVGEAIVENSDLDLKHANLSRNSYTGEEYLLESFSLGKMPMPVWLNIYNRIFLLNNDLYFKKGILHEDEQFTPRVFLKAKRVIYTHLDFYHYIVRENSITTKKDKRKNIQDFYSTCVELEKEYRMLPNKVLETYMRNSLCDKYLSMYYAGKIFRYGKQYTHKRFVLQNASLKRTKIKALLFCLNPGMYCWINHFKKKMRKK